MPKVFIQSQDLGYAQYLKSLVQQVAFEPELEVQYVCGPKDLPHKDGQPALLVVYESPDADLLEPLLQLRSWDQTIWISNNKAKKRLQLPDSSTVVFYRPIDSSDFVRCVHQWLKGQSQNGHHLKQAPEEPFLVGISQAIRLLRKKIDRIREYDFAVLVCGATGTGKEVVAHALHNNSPRSCNQFLIINCANVPASLLESELFGYRKGAFTGAWNDKPGRFELAQEGTIFLDEISEMSTYMQAKLLQVLQEKEFAPLGGICNVKIKSRVVAATNADLKNAVAQGTFRKDLYYRLAVIRLELPRLRDRKEDVPVLVHHFLDKFSLLYQKKEVPSLSDRFWDILLAYDWPGNVRELESSIQSLVALESEELVQEKLCKMLNMNPASGNSGEGSPMRIPGLGCGADLEQELSLQDMSLQEISQQAANRVEAELISMALNHTGGKKRQTAQVLDISYKCLLKKIKSYGL